MKKFFSLVLTLAMVMSLAAVSLASHVGFTIADDEMAVIASIGDEPYKTDSDTGIMKDDPATSVAYGNTVYFPIYDEEGDLITKTDAVKGIGPKTEWEVNGDYVSAVELVKKKVSTGYGYFLSLKFISSTKTAATDVIGKITLKKSSGDYKIVVNADHAVTLDLALSLKYSNVVDAESTPDMDVIFGSKYLYDFDGSAYADLQDEEFELTFDEIADATFTVNTIGQGDLILAADPDFNADIAAKFPSANLEFFNGNGASFNKTGEMFLPADADTFLYQVKSDGTLALVASAEYDDSDEGFYFKTRTLGTYIVSDEELDLAVVAAPSVEPAAPDINPSTGAAA